MKYLFLILALLCSNAFAIGLGNDNPPGGGTATAVAAASNTTRIDNDVRANAAAWQGQLQGQAQQQAITVNAGTAAAPVSMSVQQLPANDEVKYSGVYKVKNTPDVMIGNTYPTAPCMGGTNIGGSGPGFSLAIGGSWTDEECSIRETARSFNGLGLKDDAIKVLCTSKFAAAAPSCKGG